VQENGNITHFHRTYKTVHWLHSLGLVCEKVTKDQIKLQPTDKARSKCKVIKQV